MSRTVTALYDTRAEAEAARDRLSSAVDVQGRAQILDKTSMGSGSGGGSSSLHRMPLSHEDRHAYGEGIRRGGFMLCAEVDGDEDAAKIVRILEETSSVDLDERQNAWRSEGWQGYSPSTHTGGAGMGSTGMGSTGGGLTGGATSGSAGQGLTGGASATGHSHGQQVAEEHIPIVEEELVVGKREVSRGGARVRSYVREVPVHEQVTLREEHVDVERRPVNERLDRGALERDPDLLRDRTIEMTETAEEAVVGKEARVVEEVVVSKTVDQRTEQIDDTVRHTEVEIDEGLEGGRDAGAFKFDGSGGRGPGAGR
jgi:uncharacterized protein (TIGR02271 family)